MTCFPLGEVPPIGGDRGAFPSDDSPVVKVFAADRQRCRRQAAITCGDRRHHNPLNLLNLLNLLNPLNPSRRAAPIGVHFHRAKPGCLVFHSAKQNYKTHRREAAPTAIPHPLNPLNLLNPLNPHADRRAKRPVNLKNLFHYPLNLQRQRRCPMAIPSPLKLSGKFYSSCSYSFLDI